MALDIMEVLIRLGFNSTRIKFLNLVSPAIRKAHSKRFQKVIYIFMDANLQDMGRDRFEKILMSDKKWASQIITISRFQTIIL